MLKLEFTYSNAFVSIRNSITVKDGDVLVFCEKRYTSNILIGVSGQFCEKYVKEAKERFINKFPNGIKVDADFWADISLVNAAKKCLKVFE